MCSSIPSNRGRKGLGFSSSTHHLPGYEKTYHLETTNKKLNQSLDTLNAPSTVLLISTVHCINHHLTSVIDTHRYYRERYRYLRPCPRQCVTGRFNGG